MKRFLFFYHADSVTIGSSAGNLYIGEFDRAEGILIDIPALREASGIVGQDGSLEILDTHHGTWHEIHLFPLEESHAEGSFAHHYQKNLSILQGMTNSGPVPAPKVERFVLFGITEHERAGPTDDLLASFDSTQKLVDALAKFIEEVAANDEATLLTPRWDRLKENYKWLEVLDLQTDSILIVKWEQWNSEHGAIAYSDDYRKFLEFEQHAKRTMADYTSTKKD